MSEREDPAILCGITLRGGGENSGGKLGLPYGRLTDRPSGLPEAPGATSTGQEPRSIPGPSVG